MDSFAACRGDVFVFGTSSRGAYAMSPGPTGTSGSPVLINGVESSDIDVAAPVITLNRSKILYTFGDDFGQIAIHGTVLLGRSGGGGGSALQSVMNVFKSARVSSSGGTVNVSLPGGGGYKVYLTGLSISVPDQEYNIQKFAYTGLIAEAN
jgi:hypothetical protein